MAPSGGGGVNKELRAHLSPDKKELSSSNYLEARREKKKRLPGYNFVASVHLREKGRRRKSIGAMNKKSKFPEVLERPS